MRTIASKTAVPSRGRFETVSGWALVVCAGVLVVAGGALWPGASGHHGRAQAEEQVHQASAAPVSPSLGTVQAGQVAWASQPLVLSGGDPAVTAAQPLAIASEAPVAETGLLTIEVPRNVRIIDTSAFIVDGVRYRLTGTDALGVGTGCTADQGGRCFRHPRKAFKQAIAGTSLACREQPGSNARETLVGCTRAGAPVRMQTAARL